MPGLLDFLGLGGQQPMQAQAPGQARAQSVGKGLLGGFAQGFNEMRAENPEALLALSAGLLNGDMAQGVAGMTEAVGDYRQDKRQAALQREGWDRQDARFDKTFGLQQDRFNLERQSLGTERAQALARQNATANWLRASGAAPALVEMAESGAGGEAMRIHLAQQQGIEPTDDMREFDYAQQNPEFADWMHGNDSGLSVTLPNGTSIRQGSFSNQDQKNVANRVTAEQEAAAAASGLKQTVDMLRNANQNVGYSGVGGNVYDAVDSTLEQMGADVLPGNARSRSIMRSGGLDVALGQVQKTVGAISNAEMGLFMAAAPGLKNTPAGNAALLDMIDAIADRQLQRVEEMERWRQQYGTLDGFESAWGEFIAQNPLIVKDSGGGIRLNEGSGGGGNNDPLGLR